MHQKTASSVPIYGVLAQLDSLAAHYAEKG